jgi:hypothetical protein
MNKLRTTGYRAIRIFSLSVERRAGHVDKSKSNGPKDWRQIYKIEKSSKRQYNIWKETNRSW